MPNFGLPRFNRRYVLLPMLSAIALVMAAYLISEHVAGRTQANIQIRQIQERMHLLTEVEHVAVDAEAAQRDYLLTMDAMSLQLYKQADVQLRRLMSQLIGDYIGNPAELAQVQRANESIKTKFSEIQSIIEKRSASGNSADSVRLANKVNGLHFVQDVRDALEGINDRERERVYASIASWERQQQISLYILRAETALIVVLILVSGALVTRAIERRSEVAQHLERLVNERTSELSHVSEHLQRATELEKSRLARELHDELGGLLVAIKMDLAQLARTFDMTAPDLQVRWQRIQSALSAGVELKRRVIEELRPTLLDNMGLVAALRWQAEETCANAAITLDAQFPDVEVKLDTHAAIAVFRVAQESLNNIVKHARATRVAVKLQVSPIELVLTIQDNGIGISPDARQRAGAHGLLSMKYRMQSIGGSFIVDSPDAQGTLVVVRQPLELPKPVATAD